MKRITSLLLMLLVASTALAQTTLSGSVVDENNQAVPGVNIVLSSSEGTVSDFDGNFEIETNQSFPINIDVSAIGFASQQIELNDASALNIVLLGQTSQLEEIVVAASRRSERLAESPVSIERLNLQDIKNTTAQDFYQSLNNLKGVDVNMGSVTLPIINTRGFATFGNERFLQLVDGMDSAAPGLNFAVANLIGLNELDVASVEILPGASSALYGANAFNGILLMRSQTPWEKEGISASVKGGVTSSSNGGDNSFYDYSVRAAIKLSDKFALKLNLSTFKGKDWYQTDDRQSVDAAAGSPDQIFQRSGNELAYDAISIYGDEITQDLNFQEIALITPQARGLVAQGVAAQLGIPDPSLIPGIDAIVDQQIIAAIPNTEYTIGMPGYQESDLWDYTASNTKFDATLYYKITDDVELSWQSKIATGDAIYQGQSRYVLEGLGVQQHKLELRGKNFFVRGYTTIEDSGDAFDAVYTGQAMIGAQAVDWYNTYTLGFLQSMFGGATAQQAHQIARPAADAILLQPGSTGFNSLYENVTSTPLYSGSRFTDNSKLTHFDANYNFGDLGKLGELQIGGSYRSYTLDSNGTIFTDYNGDTISVNEYGIYTQLQTKISEKLKFTGSIRYDGATNYDSNFSPRLSLVFSPDEAKKHNFRLSYQTGFRYPTNQDQYIGLETPRGIILGSGGTNFDRFRSQPLGTAEELGPEGVGLLNLLGIPFKEILTGNDILNNSYSFSSVVEAVTTGDLSRFRKAEVKPVVPEKVTAYEIGYRGQIGRFFIDANYYFNNYDNFIAGQNVATPWVGDVQGTQQIPGAAVGLPIDVPAAAYAIGGGLFSAVSIDSNTDADVKSSGFNLGIDTNFGNYNLGFSYTYANLDFDQAQAPDYESGFNTPENSYKFSFSNPKLSEKLGFGINYRYLESFLWQSTYYDGIVPERSLLDAQITYSFSNKLNLKVGGTNLLGDEYYAAPGAGLIGSTYYVGLRYGL